jgi:hypothetical protein
MKAEITGSEYRAGEEALNSGANVINFSGPLSTSDYTLFYYTRGASGYQIATEITSTSAAGFGVEVSGACTITYYAVPKN